MGDSTPICRCRVLYLGSAVPRQSKDGLQGIQEPLRSLYPSEGALGAKGIDSWLSVWSNGILLENVDENRKQVTRFFPIESLHYCAAVRQVLVPERGNSSPEPKFLPLDSPFARTPKSKHPPIFAAILRRTTGIKVLECHVFICKREAAANALVRCCFHAYADNSYAKQLETGGGSSTAGLMGNGSVGGGAGSSVYGTLNKPNGDWRSRAGSTMTLNSLGRSPAVHASNGMLNGSHQGRDGASLNGIGDAYTMKNLYASSADLNAVDLDDTDGNGSIYNGDENHKVWTGSQDRLDAIDHDEGPYDIYGGSAIVGANSTIGRTPRARQISAPVPVPSPPKEELTTRKQHRKSGSGAAKSLSGSRSMLLGGGSQSLSGTLIRPKPVHAGTLMRVGPHGQHAMMYAGPPHPGHHMQPPPPPHRQFHTFSHRGFMQANGGHPPPAHQHHLVQMHGPPPPPPHLMQPPPPHHHHMLAAPFLLPQQYATLQNPARSTKSSSSAASKHKLSKKDKQLLGNGAIPLGIPVQPPAMYAASMIGEPRPLALSNRKLAQSAAAGLDDGGSGGESPGGTGIYRRKGHLNERAFSYSIRQEHRSRSHSQGSLSSLQYDQKEKEIAQMVAGLDLNGHAMDGDMGTLGSRHPQQQHYAHYPAQAHGVLTNGGTGTFGKPRR